MTGALGQLRDGVEQRPATALLAALLAGLLCGPAGVGAQALAALGAGAVSRTPRAAGLLLLAVLAGALTAGARGAALERTALGPRLGHDLRAAAVLDETPRATRRGWRAGAELAGERVLLQGTGGPPRLETGRVLAVAGVLRAPRSGEDWLRVRHVHAVLEVRSVRAAGPLRRGGAAGVVDRVRDRAQRALAARLPDPEGALLQGMVLGDDAHLTVDDRDRLRRAGLGHLVAASGANIALLGALAVAVCAALGAGLRARLVAVLLLIAFYVPLAGAGPSIQRAGVMGAAALAATLAARPVLRWHALLLAAVVTLAADPSAVRDPGWQLSFAAVAAIAVVAAPVAAVLARRGVPRGLSDAVALTLAATIGTAPVSAAAFGTVSPVGLVANVLVAPLVAPITWIGMVAASVAQLSERGGGLIAVAAGPPAALVLAVGRRCAALPGAQIGAGVLPVAATTIALVAAVLFERARRPVVVAATVALLAVLARLTVLAPDPLPPPARGVLRVAFLDIGQGDATLVQSGDHAMLVDSGPPDGPVLARLRDLGVRRLDVLVATHAQADHIGGVDRVLRSLPVGGVLDGRDGVREHEGDELARAARERGTALVPARAGQRMRLGMAEAQVLWPPPATAGVAGGDPNDRAVVLLVRGAGVRLLLTADAESDVLQRLGLGPTELLKVSHHGSADPGLPALLGRITPRLAVIEVGRDNSYGHPTPQALGALGDAGVPVLRTDRDGTVVVEARDGRLHVQARS